nr:MAG TPA: hypothetical protein [Caudoviricetes sp.]
MGNIISKNINNVVLSSKGITFLIYPLIPTIRV